MTNELHVTGRLPLSVVARTVTGTFLLLLSKFGIDFIEFLLRDGVAVLGWFDERSVRHVEQARRDLAEAGARILIDGYWREEFLRSTGQRFSLGECFPGHESNPFVPSTERRSILTSAIDRKRTGTGP